MRLLVTPGRGLGRGRGRGRGRGPGAGGGGPGARGPGVQGPGPGLGLGTWGPVPRRRVIPAVTSASSFDFAYLVTILPGVYMLIYPTCSGHKVR
jgi:hypothetical protein